MEWRQGRGVGGLCGLAWCERHDPIENGRWEGGMWSRWPRWSISISHYTKKRTGPPEQIPTPPGTTAKSGNGYASCAWDDAAIINVAP